MARDLPSNEAISIADRAGSLIKSANQNMDHEKVRNAAELYDRVASCFGPHEHANSTRGRLFNKFK